MYNNNDINWIQFLKNKKVYIFGAGKMGKDLYAKLNRIPGMCVAGAIDNNKSVVADAGVKDFFINTYTFDEYKTIKSENDFLVISTAYHDIALQLLKENICSFVDYETIDFPYDGESYYDDEYFKMQLEFAKVDSVIDYDFFFKYIKETDNVAEFGMGGGLLLEKIKCKFKVGIEINPIAREHARQIGIDSVENFSELQDNCFDVVISSHALEHCLDPFKHVLDTYRILKEGGKAVFVVPYEPITYEYYRSDRSRHLYIWNQRTLGNLFKTAGFLVRCTGVKEVAWPKNWESMFNEEMRQWFDALSVVESDRIGYYSVYVVAEK